MNDPIRRAEEEGAAGEYDESPATAHQWAEYGDILEDISSYKETDERYDDSLPVTYEGEDRVDGAYVNAFYASQQDVADLIVEEASPAAQGFVKGFTWAPQVLPVIYDTFHGHDPEHTPYSFSGILREQQEEPDGRRSYISTGAGLIAGGAAVVAAPPLTLTVGHLPAGLDAADRAVQRGADWWKSTDWRNVPDKVWKNIRE